MTTARSGQSPTAQVYLMYIKATPPAVWDAITRPEWIERYGYPGRAEYDLFPGGAFRAYSSAEATEHGAPDVIIEGEVVEARPPHKLAHTWHAFFDAETAAEPTTRVTWEIVEIGDGVTQLTLTHELAGAPKLAAVVSGAVSGAGGGWSFVLSDLKTLLETGKSLAG